MDRWKDFMKILLDVGGSRMFDGKRVHWAKGELIFMWKAVELMKG